MYHNVSKINFSSDKLCSKLPNMLSSVRIILSPLFLVFFYLPIWCGGGYSAASVYICWIFIFIMDISDIFDGMLARKLRLVSDFGKMFDPYADLFARLTYFLCFVGIGIMPVWIFAVILYREISVMFLRIMMMHGGIVMAARIGGKIKEWVYAFAGIFSMLLISFSRLGVFREYIPSVERVVMISYYLAIFFSLVSFSDYLICVYKNFSDKKN